MNPSLQKTLVDLVIHGRNYEAQTGIRLSLAFLESVHDKASGMNDLRQILEMLETEQETESLVQEHLEDFQLRHDQQITAITSTVYQLRSNLRALKLHVKSQEDRLAMLKRQIERAGVS